MRKQVLKLSVIAAMFGVTFMACKEEEALPPIGGYNSASEVGSANLVAYWDMEGTGKEAKSSAMPTKSVNATFGTGVKGKGVTFADGYMAFDAISALNSLPNVTVSAWVNVSNNGSSPACFFSLSRPNQWAGNINLMAETGWKKATSDTMVVKGLVVTKVNGNDSWQDSRNEPTKGGVQSPKIGGKWAHVVMTWDGATSMFKIYANGVKISNPEWEARGTTGPLNFTTPTKAIIGTWGTVVGGNPESWQKAMTGSMDEIRVFNKALSDADISALYQLEMAGR